MAEGRARKVGTAVVVRTERLSPHMVRIVLGGAGLAGFGAGQYTDHYVKLLFAPAGVTYTTPGTWTGSGRPTPARNGRASVRTRCAPGTRSTWS